MTQGVVLAEGEELLSLSMGQEGAVAIVVLIKAVQTVCCFGEKKQTWADSHYINENKDNIAFYRGQS